MKDILIPLGLILFIVIFIYAFIHTSRKQGKAKSRVFSDFADKYGIRYLEIDDGKAQGFAKGLKVSDGLAHLLSVKSYRRMSCTDK